MRDILDGIIKLLQYISVSAIVCEFILRLVCYFLTHEGL